MTPADDNHGVTRIPDLTAEAERRRLAGIMVALGGDHTVDTVPDDVTPYRARDGGGWSTKALDRYLDEQLGGSGE
jgi:hypothetical protein